MSVEVRRHCKNCQSNFTVAVPTRKQALEAMYCPSCGMSIPAASVAHESPVREARHPVSGATQQHLF